MVESRIGGNTYQDAKLEASRKVSEDADDALEEDGDVVFQLEDDNDTDSDGNGLTKSLKASKKGTKFNIDVSRDGEIVSDLDFSDLDDAPVSKRKEKQNHATKSKKIDVEDDDDNDDDRDRDNDYNRGRGVRGFKDRGNLSFEELDDEDGGYNGDKGKKKREAVGKRGSI
mgnify:CR=1 FL=1